MAMPREAGPWGASGAKPWDDGVFFNVKQIRVLVGESLKVIHAIQFEYVRRDGQSVLSQLHGGQGGEKTQVVCTIILYVLFFFISSTKRSV